MRGTFSFFTVFIALTIVALSCSTATASAPTPPGGYLVHPFKASQVSLSTGVPWKIAETRVTNYLKSTINVNNFLYAFRRQYGLSVSGMQACGTWEAPNCKLCGHATGHVLSALSMNYALTKDATVLSKLQQLVRGLDTCQSLATSRGFSAGCLSASGEWQFPKLEAGAGYNATDGDSSGVWAPWYSQHKLLQGFVDCYINAGDTVALRVAKNMGTWAYNRLSKLSSSTLASMWSRYIAGEYGGYNESAAELYMVTKDSIYLKLAQLFDDNTTQGASLTNLSANTDRLGNTHANMYMPRIIGYLRIYDANLTPKYYNAAYYFWDMVYYHHIFCHGGCSTVESFTGRDAIASNIQVSRSCETCPSFNLSKLSRFMFYHNPQAKYIDYFERVNTAQLLSNANITGAAASASMPFACYMTNVKCGDSKASGGDDYNRSTYSYTCCDGTGLESHVRYTDPIYAYAGDTLYVNLFFASRLDWTERGKTVTITSTYPASDTVTITATGAGNMPLKIRSPWWVRRPVQIWVDGVQRHIGPVRPSTYFKLDAGRGWNGSGTVRLVVPQTLWCEKTPDDATKGSIFYGGQNLYGATNVTSFQSLNCGTFTKSSGLTWTASGFTFKPFYNVASDFYSLYWNVTNIPANWQDTVLDTQDDPPVAIHPASSILKSLEAAPMVTIHHSQIRISFSSSFADALPLRAQFFNAKGAKIADLKGMLHKGARSVFLSNKKPASTSGVYMYIIVAGSRVYKGSVVANK
ncbi:MAG: glycoside hydrolase family 127 protein [Chitinispirillaceae bacterium]|nr:glycoside hydrolase family 127 protein [Chitinispirillaceae bacterium]